MKPQIPWLRVFVEGVVIVGSILLAFGIDAWWEERQERAEEQQVLSGLEQDLAFDLQSLGNTLRALDSFQERLLQLQALTPQEIDSLSAGALSEYVRSLQGFATFNARTGTMESIIASGKLNLVRDPSVRDALVSWVRQISDSHEEAEALREVTTRAKARAAELGGPWTSGTMDGPLGEVPVAANAMSQFPLLDLNTVVADPTLLALAREKRHSVVLYLLAISNLASDAEEVLTLIEASLE